MLELRSSILKLGSSVFVTAAVEGSVMTGESGREDFDQNYLKLKGERAFCTRVKSSGWEEAKYQ